MFCGHRGLPFTVSALSLLLHQPSAGHQNSDAMSLYSFIQVLLFENVGATGTGSPLQLTLMFKTQ